MTKTRIFNEIEVAEPFASVSSGCKTSCSPGREQKATLHYVLSGAGEIQLIDHPSIKVAAGAVVLIPATMKHSLHGEKGGTELLPKCKPAMLGLAHHVGTDPASDRLQVLCGRVSIGLRGSR
jgi:hypothetical protein